MRESCTSRVEISWPICWFSCWYCASSSAFLACDSSYFDCDTQLAISTAAPNTHTVGNFVIGVLLSLGLCGSNGRGLSTLRTTLFPGLAKLRTGFRADNGLRVGHEAGEVCAA